MQDQTELSTIIAERDRLLQENQALRRNLTSVLTPSEILEEVTKNRKLIEKHLTTNRKKYNINLI